MGRSTATMKNHDTKIPLEKWSDVNTVYAMASLLTKYPKHMPLLTAAPYHSFHGEVFKYPIDVPGSSPESLRYSE